jgi:hypothetical protein
MFFAIPGLGWAKPGRELDEGRLGHCSELAERVNFSTQRSDNMTSSWRCTARLDFLKFI